MAGRQGDGARHLRDARVGNKYKLNQRKMGSGSFGEVFLGATFLTACAASECGACGPCFASAHA